eukprot:COSAG06_NODE_28321_length_576_cov_1.394130_1_plen_46_part_10
MDEKKFLSTRRPIHQWKAGELSIPTMYREPAADIIPPPFFPHEKQY